MAGPDLKKPLIAFFLCLFLIGVVFTQSPKQSAYHEHYYFLSKSLLNGKLDVTTQLKTVFNTPQKMKGVFDYAIFKNQYFLHLGVFPGVIGIPFLIFGRQGHSTVQIYIFLALAILLLARFTKHYLKEKSLLMPILLIIASPLLTTLTWRGPWYLAGLMIFVWGLFFLWYTEVKNKNWGLILLLPLFLTRPTTIFYALIPLVKIFKKNDWKKKAAILFLILSFGLSTFFVYNYLRFGNILTPGYKYTKVPAEEFRQYRKTEISFRDYSISNAIYLFINPPRPFLNQAIRFVFPYFELSRNGVGLIFIIPWFLPYLFFNRKKIDDWPYWLAISAMVVTIILFKGEGSFQIGPRYACDFLPLLVFINFKWLKKDKNNRLIFKKLLIIALILSLYFFFLVQLGHINRV